MKQNLYFHAGLPKTGTTTIQSFLTENHLLLKEKGINYPPLKHSQKFRSVINGIDFLQNSHLLKDITEPNIIISCEDFASQTDWLSDELADKYEIKVIIYVRRSIDAILSLWAEMYKNLWHEPKSFEEDIVNAESHFANYSYSLFDYIGEKISPHNVIIRPFEKEQMVGGDIIKDFLAIFDMNTQDQPFVFKNTNVSPSYGSLEAMRSLYGPLLKQTRDCSWESIIKDGGILNTIDVFFANDIGTDKISPDNLLSDEKIKEICDRYYNFECDVATKYLGRSELFTSKYPACYLKPRELYKGIYISNRQLELINYEIKQLIASLIQKNDSPVS